MTKYVATFEKLRKKAALSIAILIAITVVFITFMTHSVNNLYEEVDGLESFEAERVEDFLEQSLERDKNFLTLWEKDWEIYSELYGEKLTTEQLIDSFITRRLSIAQEISTSSVVLFIKSDNEIIYLDYRDLRYEQYRKVLEDLTIITPPSGEQIILNNDGRNQRFGTGERIFLTGITLNKDKDDPLYLFIGFHEKIKYESFLNTLDITLLKAIENDAEQILTNSIIYLIIVIVYGLILIFLIRWFTYRTILWFAKIYPFGEIAIKKGYLTEEQVNECLLTQEIEVKKRTKSRS